MADSEPITTAEEIISVVFLVLFNVVTISGNILVLAVVYKIRKLHEPNYYFLSSLAIADLLVGVMYCPLLIASIVKGRWDFGTALCHAHGMVICASFNSSIASLCAISIDRYYYIMKPFKYKNIVTKTRALLVVMAVWFFAVFWAVIPISTWGEYAYDEDTKTCKPNFSGHGYLKKSYAICLGISCFFIPTSTMIISYVLIYKKAREHGRNVAIEITRDPGQLRQAQIFQISFQRKYKALFTVLIIVGIFCLCWSLYTVVTMWRIFGDVNLLPAKLVRWGLYFALSNSGVNFYIYALRDDMFRRGLRSIWRRIEPINLNNRSLASTSELAVASRAATPVLIRYMTSQRHHSPVSSVRQLDVANR